MNFSSIGSSSSFGRAGKAAANDTLKSFLAARKHSPNYGEIVQRAAEYKSAEKKAAVKIAGAVTRKGISEAGAVKKNEILADAKASANKSNRKAGALATAGKMFGMSSEFSGNERTRRTIGENDDLYDKANERDKAKAAKYRELAKGTDTTTPSSTSSDSSDSDDPAPAASSSIPAYSAPKGGKIYSKDELLTLAQQGGFSAAEAPRAAQIAMGESSGKSTAFNGKGQDQSYGLMQINMLGDMGPERRQQFGLSSNEDLYDPLTNMKAAHSIYKQQGWGAWGAFTNGSYANY